MALNATVEALDRLLEIQAHDTVLDRLVRERAEIAARETLAAALQDASRIDAERSALVAELEVVQRDEQRRDHEATAAGGKAAEVEATLYSGSVTSPRELEALQADVAQLRAQQSHLEDLELECMEQREALERSIAASDERRAEVDRSIAALRAEVESVEGRIDTQAAAEHEARAALAASVDPGLLADYEGRRARNGGVGIARLVGHTCAACGLTIPAVEVDRFRHADPGTLCSPDDCECIIVPK